MSDRAVYLTSAAILVAIIVGALLTAGAHAFTMLP